jgi:hypothetical protein
MILTNVIEAYKFLIKTETWTSIYTFLRDLRCGWLNIYRNEKCSKQELYRGVEHTPVLT